ncbi:sulfate ABC transporter permease subunit CysW [Patulibacter minatonensis]|uniref:sulfate ABC transporter permease subunit CysW n=1 Tax=Patulibacter minatonensis TaxID=298163 RepID=UPI00047DCE4B|nr:sulfate ABC transporter permease subunit CysW [Patulibacter minatonensis]
MRVSRRAQLSLRTLALAYLFVLLIIPLGIILYRTFEHGASAVIDSVTTPAAVSAFWLTIEIVTIAVVLNTVFGVLLAIALVRSRVRGKSIIQVLVDLPFAVSPVVVGVSLLLVYGNAGWFGTWLAEHGIKVIFSVPGMVLATIFVTVPFVVREVEPVLREIGTEQEEAAATLGASRWQTFWRITLPAIRWGLAYGVILTIARALGEYGGVSLVSQSKPGESQTLTLLVKSRYDNLDEAGAYAAATLLMVIAVVALIIMTVLDRKKSNV